MVDRKTTYEPMCETSEKGEKLIARDELLPAAANIGRRILEVFGYQKLSHIVFRLKTNRPEMEAILNGRALPSTELLLGIHKTTGASIDWLLTGKGSKYLPLVPLADPLYEPVPTAAWFSPREGEMPTHVLPETQ